MIRKVNGKEPRIDPTAFIAPTAVVLGEVELGPQVSVWYGCVLRADINWIRVGARSNLQDGVIVHVAHRGQGTLVGCEVVVGHRVILHSCTVEDGALIGMGAVVMDRAVVGAGSVIGAGAVVPPDSVIPPRSLAVGVPARVRREVGPEELARVRATMGRYLRVQECHRDPEVVIDFSREE